MHYSMTQDIGGFSLDAIVSGFGQVGTSVRDDLSRLEDDGSLVDIQILDLDALELVI